MSERSKRKAARTLLSKAGYGGMGGHFAKGGHVKSPAAAVHKHESHLHKGQPKTKLADGGCASGGNPRPRADKLKRGGKVKPGKVVVNVNVLGGKDAAPAPKPIPVPVPAGGGAPPPMPMSPPGAGPGGPLPPELAGAGGPPMGLKRGGRAKSSASKAGSQREHIKGMPAGHFKKGGRTKMPVPMDAGAGGAKGRLEKIKDYGAG